MFTEINKNKILIVDDEPNVRESLRMILSNYYDVQTAEDGELAVKIMRESDSLPVLVLLDLMMPGRDGLEILADIKQLYPQMAVIILTASTGVKSAVAAMKIGAVDYLNKPYDVDELLSLIEETLRKGASGRTAPSKTAIHQVHVENELDFIEGDFGRLVGKHPLMKELYEKITAIAARETTILITGESGTGKEVVANEIHKRSHRSNGPYVAINCAAIPETLIESELFGHEKGAFTHAIDRRVGHFENANGGTLLLDEIGELNLSVQVKMLRFLQEKEFYRVGYSKPTHVDVRVLAATNKSLEAAVRNGTFREDLFYRVNVVVINVPALRERREDIPDLLDYFVRKLAPFYGTRKITFTVEALECLCRYGWPGNVRELENITESLLALCNKETIDISDLPQRIRYKDSGLAEGQSSLSFEDAEKAFETDLILKALQSSNFVQTKAAELLGISRRILKYKMDKLGIALPKGSIE
ncbi:MAG: sigma-54-dependent Fis family transcriptional regulator [Deltaproteobacteria bacterium]|nr:sigma-54-dependent Fis family transcriptional regulator [Deltaproteobacteria bacterium]